MPVKVTSLRPRSTNEQLVAALARAVRALKGSTVTMTFNTVGKRAAQYVPESDTVVIQFLHGLDDDTLRERIGLPPDVISASRAMSAQAQKRNALRWRKRA